MSRAIAEGTAGAVGEDFLRGLVRTMTEAFGAKLAFVGEATRDDGAHVRVAGWYDGGFMGEPFEYDTQGLPCALAVENAFVAFPRSSARVAWSPSRSALSQARRRSR